MSKYKYKKITKLQIDATERQRVVLFLGAAAIISLSAHINDIANAINSQIDSSYGITKALDEHHHIHTSDLLIDRRHIVQYNSEEKSTSDRDRDNWEVYENALGVV